MTDDEILALVWERHVEASLLPDINADDALAAMTRERDELRVEVSRLRAAIETNAHRHYSSRHISREARTHHCEWRVLTEAISNSLRAALGEDG